jgi:hypothetical protein
MTWETKEALKNLRPDDRQLVRDVMADAPGLPVEEAIEALRAFGGL